MLGLSAGGWCVAQYGSVACGDRSDEPGVAAFAVRCAHRDHGRVGTALPAATPPPALPDAPSIVVVSSFAELVAKPFADGVNAYCWQRTLAGDFEAVVAALGSSRGVTVVDEQRLRGLALDAAASRARDTLLDDVRLLREHGLAPELDCVRDYDRDALASVVATDVYSFHVDRATAPTDTYLCSYTTAASEGLLHADALRRIDDPATRAALLQQYGGADDPGFARFLRDHCYDLHYVARSSARPFSFGLGNLWRLAVQHPSSLVPAFVHRAPTTSPGSPARLLLIS